MPTAQQRDSLYPAFGVDRYHKEGIQGQGVSMYLIDTGLSQVKLKNTIQRPVGEGSTSQGHGGFVANIVAKEKETSEDIPGICPESKIYLGDVDDSTGVIQTSYLVSAINDAIALDVDIISISLGTNEFDVTLEDSIARAAMKNILVFASTGNCNCRMYEYPAACENAISVASVNPNKGLSVFNTRNDNVSLFAPGESLITGTAAESKSSSSRISGTSFATPFAAGLAALVLSKMRKESKKKSMRISKNQMISILRNDDHLGLSCEVHNQSRSNGCSVAGISDATVPILQSSVFFKMNVTQMTSLARQMTAGTVLFLMLSLGYTMFHLYAKEAALSQCNTSLSKFSKIKKI